MKKVFDLSALDWTLTGCTPYIWKYEGSVRTIDTGPLKACVPGSVQLALLDAGIIDDWNIGSNSTKCEWIENRHWIYSAEIPNGWVDLNNETHLNCLGLDYSGWVYLNDSEIGSFEGTHIPHNFELTQNIKRKNNVLQIIFDTPPRWLGQFGHTSEMTQWKTRFNYTWDWVPRLVQIGIWDSISLISTDGIQFENFKCTTDADHIEKTGKIFIKSNINEIDDYTVKCVLSDKNTVVFEQSYPAANIKDGISIEVCDIRLWWPNQEGEQYLYKISCSLIDSSGNTIDETSRNIGFRNVSWTKCEDAPKDAEPWICVVNGKPVFLQGLNFQPIRANYADLKPDDYEKRLKNYRDIGVNFLRINACGFLEYECFYDLCDQMGIMVWQEFPLTSSGIENWPPEDEKAIIEMGEIAESFIQRRHHHASLIVWGGGNELQGDLDGRKYGIGKPCEISHPMLKALQKVVQKEDPGKRYIHTSPYGPHGSAYSDFGEGLHWDVHGPNVNFETDEEMKSFWDNDDSLFRSEIYCSGANSVESVRKYKGDYLEMPASLDNLYWRRPTCWWNDWEILCKQYGREPESLEEYVLWSQKKQAHKLAYSLKRCKDRFPKMGGTLLWGSHETFPVPVNSTILDFDGNQKPVALEIAKVWLKKD